MLAYQKMELLGIRVETVENVTSRIMVKCDAHVQYLMKGRLVQVLK